MYHDKSLDAERDCNRP